MPQNENCLIFQNLYGLLSSAEQKRKYFKEYFNCFCPKKNNSGFYYIENTTFPLKIPSFVLHRRKKVMTNMRENDRFIYFFSISV